MNVVQGGLPSGSDHERAFARPVAEDRTAGAPQILRLRARVWRPALGEARPGNLSGGLQASQRRAKDLHHGWRQAGN